MRRGSNKETKMADTEDCTESVEEEKDWIFDWERKRDIFKSKKGIERKKKKWIKQEERERKNKNTKRCWTDKYQ